LNAGISIINFQVVLSVLAPHGFCIAET